MGGFAELAKSLVARSFYHTPELKPDLKRDRGDLAGLDWGRSLRLQKKVVKKQPAYLVV